MTDLPFNQQELDELERMEANIIRDMEDNQEVVAITMAFPIPMFHEWIAHLHQVSLGNTELDMTLLDFIGTLMTASYVHIPTIDPVDTSTDAYHYWHGSDDDDDDE